MTDREIDEVLARIATRSPPVDPAVLERITRSLETSVTRVKPLPAPWVLTARLLVASAVTAAAAATWAGFDGIASLGPSQRVILLATLGMLTAIVARECVARWIPGSRVRLSAAAVLAGGCGVLLLLFGLLFRDYRADHFLTAGLGCLEQGMFRAIPAGILAAVILRHGFATRPVVAALTVGALAGLTGVGFLELHCTNFEASHQLVWHTAVLPVAAALGALVAWLVALPIVRRQAPGAPRRRAP